MHAPAPGRPRRHFASGKNNKGSALFDPLLGLEKSAPRGHWVAVRTLKRNHANQIGLQRLDALEQGIANEPHVGTHGGNRVQQGEAVHGSEGVVGSEHDSARTRNAV